MRHFSKEIKLELDKLHFTDNDIPILNVQNTKWLSAEDAIAYANAIGKNVNEELAKHEIKNDCVVMFNCKMSKVSAISDEYELDDAEGAALALLKSKGWDVVLPSDMKSCNEDCRDAYKIGIMKKVNQ